METTPKHWAAPNNRYSSKTYSAASATSHKRPLRRSSPSVSQHVASGEERAPQKFYQVEILDSYKNLGFYKVLLVYLQWTNEEHSFHCQGQVKEMKTHKKAVL